LYHSPVPDQILRVGVRPDRVHQKRAPQTQSNGVSRTDTLKRLRGMKDPRLPPVLKPPDDCEWLFTAPCSVQLNLGSATETRTIELPLRRACVAQLVPDALSPASARYASARALSGDAWTVLQVVSGLLCPDHASSRIDRGRDGGASRIDDPKGRTPETQPLQEGGDLFGGVVSLL
jgi:hypothetical protein